MGLLRAFALLGAVSLAAADVYMHNPRGSNDRNCERNVNRNNGNRLFDSQNNAKGGYACPRPVGGPEVQAYVPATDQGNGFFDNTQLPAAGNTSYYQKMYYLAGSKLPIEWTAQHGCGANAKEHCQIVLQYACEDTLDPFHQYDATLSATDRWIGAPRDGLPTDSQDAATDTIPDNADAAVADTENNRRYGMHENQRYYEACRQRSRNRGLFTADQNLRRNDARATRQNPNGNRNGLECPEERDYHPYWHPNPWIDIAVLHDHAETEGAVNDAWCAFYKANSQNTVAGRSSAGVCVPNPDSTQETPQQVQQRQNQGRWWNNQAECTAQGHSWEFHRLGINDATTEGAAKLAALDAVLTEPDCQLGAPSRINHLGNAEDSNYQNAADAVNIPHDGNAARYVWTVPAHYNENCVLRVRYNISTEDYPAWYSDESLPATGSADFPLGTPGLNASYNGDDDSPITQDPYVYLGKAADEFVSLAVNTNQYGRTFQDRSYVFAIRKPAPDIAAAVAAGTTRVFNLNVRGKRGNIVQTYPSVEYDFVPNNLNIGTNDIVHFQWTGSDYNPRRGCNNGEGGPPDPNTAGAANQNSRADRSNIVPVEFMSDQYPSPVIFPQGANPTDVAADRPTMNAAGTMFDDPTNPTAANAALMRMTFIKQDTFLPPTTPCLTETQLEDINNKNRRENHPRNCAKLNAAFTPYFDGGAVAMKTQGTFGYFSSRNNNFSNRDQTGRLCVANNAATCVGTILTPVSRVPVAAAAQTGGTVATLAEETFNFNEKDNDSTGDGEKDDCEEFSSFLGSLDEGTAVGLVLGMIILGAVITLGCQWGIRWYLVKPRGPADICCGGEAAKGAAGAAAVAGAVSAGKKHRSAQQSLPPPPPARPTSNSWQKGGRGSALPEPVGNAAPSPPARGSSSSRVPPNPPARTSTPPHRRTMPPGPPARNATASSSAAGGRAIPPPPSRGGTTTAPAGSAGPRVIPPPPPRR